MRVLLCMTIVASLAACVGCESSAPSTAPTVGFTAPPPPQPAAPVGAAAPDEEGAKDDSAAPAEEVTADGTDPAGTPEVNNPPAAGPPSTDAPPESAPDTAADGTLKKAETGVGVKGRGYGGPGFITTPIAAKFTVEQRIAFEAQIPSAMKIYKAAHDNKGPKTHDEFMEVIIKEHGVHLPDLVTGETYLYIPETEELMVKSPKAEGN